MQDRFVTVHRRQNKVEITKTVLFTLMFLSLSSNAFSAPFKVAILPNEPFQKGFEKTGTVQSINEHQVQLVLFNGDTKDGKSNCSDAIIGKGLTDYFNKLNAPTLYSVGDNEWTDCHRTSNGGYDPIERLSYIRKTFFHKKTSQGKNPVAVIRQGAFGEKFSENSRFIRDKIMFVALHVVGSNNNLVSTDKLCHKKSKRSQQDCEAASKEYQERNTQNIKWLKESFAIAKTEKLAGIAIVAHADIYFPFELSDGGYANDFLQSLDDKNGFTDFFHGLVEGTHDFSGQVVLIMGDSHFFKIDKAMFEDDGTLTPNFTRVETFGSNETSWVEMQVDPEDSVVFSFKPVILPSVHQLQ